MTPPDPLIFWCLGLPLSAGVHSISYRESILLGMALFLPHDVTVTWAAFCTTNSLSCWGTSWAVDCLSAD